MAISRLKWVQAFLATHSRCLKCKWSDTHHSSFQLTHFLLPIGVLVGLAGKPIAAGTWARAWASLLSSLLSHHFWVCLAMVQFWHSTTSITITFPMFLCLTTRILSVITCHFGRILQICSNILIISLVSAFKYCLISYTHSLWQFWCWGLNSSWSN